MGNEISFHEQTMTYVSSSGSDLAGLFSSYHIVVLLAFVPVNIIITNLFRHFLLRRLLVAWLPSLFEQRLSLVWPSSPACFKLDLRLLAVR